MNPPALLCDHPVALPVHRRILVSGFAGWLGVFTSLMLYMALAERYRATLSLDDGGVKWIKSLAIGATGIGGIVFGVFADRRGRRTAMIWSLLTAAAGLVLAGIARDFDSLLPAAGIAGFGIGGQWASGQTLVSETVPPAARSRFGMLAQSGAPLGLILSTSVSAWLTPHIGWRATFLGAAGLMLILAGSLRWIPESDLWRAAQTGAGPGKTRAAFLAGLADRRFLARFAAAFLVTLFCMANYWFTVTWLREFMKRQWGLDELTAAQWFLVFALGSLSGYGLFNLSASRIGLRPAFTLFSVLMASGTAMLTVFEETVRGTTGLVLLFAFVAGVGTGMWGCFGPLYAEVFPMRVRATAGGFCMNVSRGINFLAPLLVVLVGGEKLGNGVALAAAFALAAGVAIWMLPESSARRLA